MACGSVVGYGDLRFLCSPNLSSSNTKHLSLAATFITIPGSSNNGSFSFSRKKKNLQRVCASVDRVELDENPEGILSGEWPDNFSLLSYEDLKAYLEPEIFKEKMQPSTLLGEVMSTEIRTATADQTLEEIQHHFEVVSGLPVMDEGLRCIGVVSKTDQAKASHGLKSKVGEVMSAPAITLPPNKKVLDAAALMLKEKIHRIPVVNEEAQVVGMVTRTDIFRALEGLPA